MPRKVPKGVRIDVWDHYIGSEIASHKCLCCKKTTISQSMFECGHVVSIKDGGTEEIENLRPICSKCNKSMSTQNMKEYVLKYGYLIG
jgi:5-methylcytosine-specific restriction endonuclease McrA